MDNRDKNNTPAVLARRVEELEAENAELRAQLKRHNFGVDNQAPAVNDNLLQSLIDTSPDIVTVVDPDLKVRVVNQRARQVLGDISERLIGQPLENLFPADKRPAHRTLFKEFVAAPRPLTLDRASEIALTVDGETEIPVEVTLCPWQDAPETVVFVLFRDISQQQNREGNLQRAANDARNANEAKSDFLAAASHDIRQPLQTLRLIQGVLTKKLEGGDAAALVNDLEITIASMSETLDTLLDIDQLERGSITPNFTEFPIRVSLKRCAREFGRHARVKGLGLRVVDSSAIVRTDQRLLARVLQNIVSNALKYTETGKVLIGCRQLGDKLRLEIWDTGVGIPEEELGHIFDRYFVGQSARNHWSQGIGLGLAVVKHLCDLLEIEMSVVSRPGAGTVFRLSLPHVGFLPREEIDQNLEVTLAPWHILVVGADAMETSILRQFLELEGYAVSVASNAGDALTVARDLSWPDLVIADDVLPNRVKGLELIRQLHSESGEQVEAIILASQTRAPDLTAIQAAGISVLRKPAPPDELLGTIAENLKPETRVTPLETIITGTVYIIERDPGQRRYLHEMLIASGYSSKSYASAEDFLEDADFTDAACAIVGIALPGLSGLELVNKLADEAPDLPVVVLVGNNNLRAVAEALKSGAFDVIEKPIQTDSVRDVISRALQVSERSKISHAQTQQFKTKFDALTPREAEVIRHVAGGAANKEIGSRLEISERTVEGHRSRAMSKLGAHTVADVVRITAVLGIDPHEN